MCSIFGAYGQIDDAVLSRLSAHAGDRGRDGGHIERYRTVASRVQAALGNWRATPTTEVQKGRLQPYDGIVHNGVIANDFALGRKAGEVDSEVLPRVLDRRNPLCLAHSLRRVQGSYAIAVWTGDDILLACNYKPIYYAAISGAIYFSSMARHFDGLLPFGVAPVHMRPYSTLSLRTGEEFIMPRDDARRAVVIASGGLDSTVAAAQLIADGWTVRLIHYRYGCRAETREEVAVQRIANALDCELEILPLDYAQLRGASPLFAPEAPVAAGVPGAEFAHEWVPARNLLMSAHAVAYAEANGFHAVALGNNLEEAGAYPDNEEQLTTMLNALLPYAVRADYAMRFLAPVGNLMKHEIVALGHRLNAPLGETWSCYHAGAKHCGVCGPCFMRRTAFERNGLTDPVFA